jgi:hypothetical protein
MRPLLKLQNSLAFPAGRNPCFDPTHPAARAVRLSAIASGGGFINLMNGTPQSSILGTPVAKTLGVIGNCTNFPSSAGLVMPGASNSDLSGTAAAIVMFDSLTGGYQIVVSSGNYYGSGWCLELYGSSSNLAWGIYGINDIPSGIAISAHVPYFLALSVLAGVKVDFVAINLVTGAIQTSTVSYSSTQPNEPTTTGYKVGCVGGSNLANTLGSIAAVMVSGAYAPLTVLKSWAQDPWSFWYPRQFDLAMALRGTQAVPNLGKSEWIIRARRRGRR